MQRLHANSRVIEHLTQDVISVPKSALNGDPSVILEHGKNRQRFDYYRNDGDDRVVMISQLPGQLPDDSVQAINKRCDTHECSKNKAIKTALREALGAFFNRKAFHINEAGAGQFPIINYFPGNGAVSFHGIETDPDHIDTMKTKMNLSASRWDGVPALPGDRPSVGVAVYALQFMVGRDLPNQLKTIISDDGFFVGNMYLNPAEKNSHRQSDFLAKTLNAGKMGYVRLRDPACSANEYWIISKTSDTASIEKFKDTLAAVLRTQPVVLGVSPRRDLSFQ